MAIVIDELVVDVPPPEATAGQQARAALGPAAGQGTAVWTAEHAHALDQQLGIAIERRVRLMAD